MSFEARARVVLIRVATFELLGRRPPGGDQWLSCHVAHVYVQLMARTRQQLSVCRKCNVSVNQLTVVEFVVLFNH